MTNFYIAARRRKKVKGRKRHIIVDVLGNILALWVHSAKIQDRDGAKGVFGRLKKRGFERLRLIWADRGYAGKLIDWVKSFFADCILEIVKRNDDVKGFEILPHRWIIERTFGWFTHYRRLSKDYEHNQRSSEAMIYVTAINIALHKLKPG